MYIFRCARISVVKNSVLSEYFVNLYEQCILLHFTRVYTVFKGTRLGVFRIHRFN